MPSRLEEVPPSPAHPTLLGERHVGFADRIRIVVVLLGLRQEEHVLVVGRGPRLDGGGHGVRLVPDDVAAENPAVVHQGQSHPPGHAQLLPVAVLVADDDPQRTGVAEHAAAFGQDPHQPLDILGGSRLVPQLDRRRVVPLLVVGRTRDDGIHSLGGQQPELLQGIAAQDRIAPVVRTPFVTAHAAASSRYILSTTPIPSSASPCLMVRPARSHNTRRLLRTASDSARSTSHCW